MAGNYVAALERIADLLATRLPDRIVTRTFRDFTTISEGDLLRGVYSIVAVGVDAYGYEAAPGPFDSGSQTELGAFVFRITGQGRIPEGSTGEAIEAAEFALLEELESFADNGITDDVLKDLLLTRTTLSQQLEAPLYWVLTEWRLRLFD